MAMITTPRRQRTNKKTWKKRVLSGKELARARREKLMKFCSINLHLPTPRRMTLKQRISKKKSIKDISTLLNM